MVDFGCASRYARGWLKKIHCVWRKALQNRTKLPIPEQKWHEIANIAFRYVINRQVTCTSGRHVRVMHDGDSVPPSVSGSHGAHTFCSLSRCTYRVSGTGHPDELSGASGCQVIPVYGICAAGARVPSTRRPLRPARDRARACAELDRSGRAPPTPTMLGGPRDDVLTDAFLRKALSPAVRRARAALLRRYEHPPFADARD